jgi:hypothetical protein
MLSSFLSTKVPAVSAAADSALPLSRSLHDSLMIPSNPLAAITFGQVCCPLPPFLHNPFVYTRRSLCLQHSFNDRVRSVIVGLACVASAQILNADLSNPMLPNLTLVPKLVSTPSIVAILAASPQAFLSPVRHVFQEKPARLHGDFVKCNSILGPMFRPSSIPEHGLAPTPNFALFSNAFHSRCEVEQNVGFFAQLLTVTPRHSFRSVEIDGCQT